MKAAPFAYVRPSTLDDVLAELTDEDAKVLAGGQSLTPVLAMRLGRPSTLVDITAVPELAVFVRTAAGDAPSWPDPAGRAAEPTDVLRIGAAVRQRAVERAEPSRAVPLLGRALPFVGHRELRSLGTVCGSLAHADPAAELPAVAACLGGTVEIAGPSGRRRVPADGFASGTMTTAAGPGEVVTAVELPVAGSGEGFGFAEIARRHGDFALAGVVTVVRVDAAGVPLSARLTGFGISNRPVTVDVTDLLLRSGPDEVADLSGRLRPATAELADRIVDTGGDAHGSTGYRRRLFGVLAARELAAAHRRARNATAHTGDHVAPRPRRARPVAKVAADELADVTLTVNGTAATVSVPPRMHLADVLRDRLGRTGTHLGCEHGVCGMCTVLVDGAAARACLLFAVQCDGADVVTVEGLGAADDQHPLQRAFSHHHGLQCGFCTPGMLLSAYDLLTHEPGVAPDDLPERMSGVLCRCTGYRGILAAVADVAAAYPDGVPEPMACAGSPAPGPRPAADPLAAESPAADSQAVGPRGDALRRVARPVRTGAVQRWRRTRGGR